MNLARRDLLALGLGATVLAPSRAFADPAFDWSAGARDPQEPAGDEWAVHDAAEIGVEGRGWSDVARDYSRLPARAEELVREPVWKLAQHSSGLFVSFTTDATMMRFEVELLSGDLAMPHMPATGVSGLDLYGRSEDGDLRWVAAAQPRQQSYGARVQGLAPGKREYRLYLPLYNGVESLRIAVPKSATLEGIAPRKAQPIVYYGTSIAHGACASRPGMSFVSQLERRLDVPMLNLGFSGNGRLELELAELIVELDSAVIVVDCLPNLGPKQTAQRTVPFIERLRAGRPKTPIVMVEDRANANAAFLPGRAEHHRGNHLAFRKAYEELVDQGVTRLTYVPDGPFLGDDGEATVDGSHPTDLGMLRYADALEPVLRAALG